MSLSMLAAVLIAVAPPATSQLTGRTMTIPLNAPANTRCFYAPEFKEGNLISAVINPGDEVPNTAEKRYDKPQVLATTGPDGRPMTFSFTYFETSPLIEIPCKRKGS